MGLFAATLWATPLRRVQLLLRAQEPLPAALTAATAALAAGASSATLSTDAQPTAAAAIAATAAVPAAAAAVAALAASRLVRSGRWPRSEDSVVRALVQRPRRPRPLPALRVHELRLLRAAGSLATTHVHRTTAATAA